MRIIIRPIGRNQWSGKTRFKYCTEHLATYYTRSGNKYTGLSPEDTKRLGEILGRDLSPNSDFWLSFTIPMTSKDLFLDTEDPLDELRYLFLLNHKRVQSSLTTPKPGANYMIINKDNEAIQNNKFNRVKRRAASEFEKLSTDDMKRCLRLYGYNAESSSNEVVESTLFDLIEGNPQRFLDKWVDNVNREVEVLLESAISKNVVRKSKNLYKYGSIIIGTSKETAVAFLLDPHKQDLRIAITQESTNKPDTLIVNRAEEIAEEDKVEVKAKGPRFDAEEGPSNDIIAEGIVGDVEGNPVKIKRSK